jgi:hypothetical protein
MPTVSSCTKGLATLGNSVLVEESTEPLATATALAGEGASGTMANDATVVGHQSNSAFKQCRRALEICLSC